nr:DUF4275 family protein [Paenibacillus tianmuensis]
MPEWGEYLRNQWEYNFANHLSHEERKQFIFMILAVA